MLGHDAWHVVVLGSTLLGAAALAIVLLAPLVFDVPPPGFKRARPVVLGLVAVAAIVLLAEWLVVHGRSI